MEKFEISNEYLTVTLSEYGGEMTRIQFMGKDRLWNGDPTFWGRTAPFLFPIVGTLRGLQTEINGKKYSMKQHGLCRIFNHDVVEKTENSITFCFSSNEETLKAYPFEFDFFTRYTLVGKKIEIIVTVVNKGQDKLIYSVGGHPAFLINLSDGDSLDDYEIYFEKAEKNLTQHIMKDSLLFENKSVSEIYCVPIDEISLNNTIIYSGFESDFVTLSRKGSGESVSAYLGGHSLIAFWKSPNSPFLCLEPWNGIGDPYDFSGKLEDKPFIEETDRKKEYDFSLVFE